MTSSATVSRPQIDELMIRYRFAFSKAAITLSLSPSYLFISTILSLLPGSMATSILNLAGRDRCSLTLIVKPIKVALMQLGIVGQYSMETQLLRLSTVIRPSLTMLSYSNVNCGCSGSLIFLMISKTSSESKGSQNLSSNS